MLADSCLYNNSLICEKLYGVSTKNKEEIKYQIAFFFISQENGLTWI